MTMRRQFIHCVRTARLLCSAMLRMAAEDPILFLEKVYQRLQQSRFRAGFKYLPPVSSRKTAIQRMFGEGRLRTLQESPPS